jgi:hypothetical protein
MTITVYKLCAPYLKDIAESKSNSAKKLLNEPAYKRNFYYNFNTKMIDHISQYYDQSQVLMKEYAKINNITDDCIFLLSERQYDILKKACEEDPSLQIKVSKARFPINNYNHCRYSGYNDCVIV